MLPDWIELPAPRPYAEIDHVDGQFVVYVGSDTIIDSFDDVYDAYSLVSHNYNFEVTAKAIDAGNVDSHDGLFMSVPSDNGMSTMMLAINDMSRWDMLQDSLHLAVANIRAYREEPNVFTAYNMLDTHPAFWKRLVDGPTWDWETDGHVSNLRFFLTEDGWMMEAGSHTPNFTEHFYDPRLDVFGDSFEECLLNMAGKIDMFFREDGTEIKGVKYEKTPMEIMLDDRLADLL